MASEIDLAVESILKEQQQIPEENFFNGGCNFYPKQPSHGRQAASNLFHNRMFCTEELSNVSVEPTYLPMVLKKTEKSETTPTTPSPLVATTKTESAAPKPIRIGVAQLTAIVDGFIEEAIFGVALELHRSAKSGALSAEEGIEERQESHFKIASTPHADVFGQFLGSKPVKQWECICPECERPLAALRFAPHLEKCMGMGRSSSRLASRRIRSTITSAPLHHSATSSSVQESSQGSSTRLSSVKTSNPDWTSNMAGLEESDDEEEEDDDWLNTKKTRDRAAKRRRTAKGPAATSNPRVKRPPGRNVTAARKPGGNRLHSVASAPNITDYSKLGTERNPGEVGPAGFHFSSEIFDTESVDYFIGGGSEVTSLIGDDKFTFEGDTADMLSERSGSELSHEPEVVWSTVPGSGTKLTLEIKKVLTGFH